MDQSLKYLYLAVGWISLGLGVIGLFLPVMPTTPFLIVTAFCFSKGSTRLHEWLLNLPRIGENIRDWEEHGVIRPRAKLIGCTMLLISFSSTVIFVPVSILVKSIVVGIGAIVIVFVLTRPSSPKVP